MAPRNRNIFSFFGECFVSVVTLGAPVVIEALSDGKQTQN